MIRRFGEPFKLETIHLDDIRDDEALVEIFASGICRTDLHCAAGYRPVNAPAVFGHEGADITPRRWPFEMLTCFQARELFWK